MDGPLRNAAIPGGFGSFYRQGWRRYKAKVKCSPDRSEAVFPSTAILFLNSDRAPAPVIDGYFIWE